jgi:hypothetical protein
LNRKLVYEENVSDGENDVEATNLVEKVELPLEKQYVQPQTIGSNYYTSGRISTTSATHLDHYRNKECCEF